MSLGMLDLTEPRAGGAPFTLTSTSRTIQAVKFNNRCEPYYSKMKGWLSFYTVTLPHPVSDARRQLCNRLSGPRYRPRRSSSGNIISDHEFYIMMANISTATDGYSPQHGWVKELRQVDEDQGGEAGTTVEDAFFYNKWLSREAEEEQINALPEVKYSWDDELREIGALAVKVEHVDPVCITFGRNHRELVNPFQFDAAGREHLVKLSKS